MAEVEDAGALRERVHELASRIVIEQAKGMLAARHHVALPTAFDAMRRASRSNHLSLQGLAVRVIAEDGTPPEILRYLYG
jgi:AmiR/NasT family two-component response regulator